MLRRFGTGRLSADTRSAKEEVNPMEGLSNMSDVMLCLAVGIMMALIMHWNVDITSVNDVKELKNAENMNNKQVEKVENNSGLQKKGVVYQDPKTHKYYIKVQK